MIVIREIAGPTPDQRWSVEGVAARNLLFAWPFAWPLLEPSMELVADGWRPSELQIATDVVRGVKQLWIAWDLEHNCCEGALLTELRECDEPLAGERLCLIYAAGGRGVRRWVGWMSRLLRPWAAAQGCTLIGHGGRRGWTRLTGSELIAVLPDFGPLYGRPTRDT